MLLENRLWLMLYVVLQALPSLSHSNFQQQFEGVARTALVYTVYGILIVKSTTTAWVGPKSRLGKTSLKHKETLVSSCMVDFTHIYSILISASTASNRTPYEPRYAHHH